MIYKIPGKSLFYYYYIYIYIVYCTKFSNNIVIRIVIPRKSSNHDCKRSNNYRVTIRRRNLNSWYEQFQFSTVKQSILFFCYLFCFLGLVFIEDYIDFTMTRVFYFSVCYLLFYQKYCFNYQLQVQFLVRIFTKLLFVLFLILL